MPSFIDPQSILDWCRIPANQLENHPLAKIRIKILPTADDVHRLVANEMAEEVKNNNIARRPTRWILPCGPTKQYRYFIEIVNKEKISLRNVHVFHMDDFLDWQARNLPIDHVYSYQGWMRRNFYALINDGLVIPEEQRHFPSADAMDEISEKIADIGGIDTTYGGIGYRGHIAYNEPPRSPWYSITNDDFRNSKTRILHLNDDTLIAVSQRTAGGCSHIIPPMAITIGMKDILASQKIRLISETGSWKQTVIRVLLFGPTTIEYPVTFVQGHPDAMVIVDHETAKPPLGE